MLLFACKCFLCRIYSCHPSSEISTVLRQANAGLTLHAATLTNTSLHTSTLASGWILSKSQIRSQCVNMAHGAETLTGWVIGCTATVQSRPLKIVVDNIIQKNSWVQGGWPAEFGMIFGKLHGSSERNFEDGNFTFEGLLYRAAVVWWLKRFGFPDWA